MENTKKYYYDKIAEVLHYLETHFTEQPSLEQLAEKVNISPYHFQKIFSEWVGVSPKKYLQYLSINYAKQMIKKQSLSATAFETGLSGTGRLHDLFVNIEGMTPGEYKQGGKNLEICFDFSESVFGDILVASTSKGICHIAFSEEQEASTQELIAKFPKARILQQEHDFHKAATSFFTADWNHLSEIKLHLKGSDFQLKVWDALLKIPRGALSTYGEIAQQIGKPKASRAVGTAIGCNPVVYLVPCHRVIQSSGNFGQYHWGGVRKKAIIGWEAAQMDLENDQ